METDSRRADGPARAGAAYELLAPAKDLACGLAALECGADAVYIGAQSLGARQAAGNPRRDVAQLITRAHLFRAKVYAAVNTMLGDAQLLEARRLITQLYEDGVDAVIIQDFGLLELGLPPVPLIASTQMHNATPQGVAFLRDAGFTRAILARELSLSDIARISAAAPGIELEAFVHGALCVSYSGRCYLSYALGGRSANRGECAQPCRKPYTVRDALGQTLAERCHALCLKDLDLSAHLGSLMAAGVTSFKIEGRLKDAAYVKNVVLWHRRALDAALSRTGGRKASSGAVVSDVKPDLVKTFNRGHTTYFLNGRDAGMHAHAVPGFLGEPVGTVRLVRGNRVDLEERPTLHAGDGIAYLDAQCHLCGTPVNKVEGGAIWVENARGLARGMRLFRNHDRLWLKALDAAHIERKMGVAMELRASGTGLQLKLKDEDGVEAGASASCENAAPRDAAAAQSTLAKQLAKLGGTPFAAQKVALPAQAIFVPVSVLNELRRNAVASLIQARIRSHPRGQRLPARAEASYPETELGFEANVANHAAEKFLRAHGVKSLARAVENGPMPPSARVMTCKYCLRHALKSCVKGQAAQPLFLDDGEGVRLRLEFDCKACVMAVYAQNPGPLAPRTKAASARTARSADRNTGRPRRRASST